MPPAAAAAASDAILKQWGAFGAILLILLFSVWWLWRDSSSVLKGAIVALTADNKELRAELAVSNAARIADRTTMAQTLVDMTRDTVAVATNSGNAVEASTAVTADAKLAMRDMTEELRRRRGG